MSLETRAGSQGCRPDGASSAGWIARLVRQFERPTGWLGRVAGWIMASRGSNRERSLWSVGLLDVKPRNRVLEIGFGPGVAVRCLAERAVHGTVTGVDHSETMWRQASRRNAAAIRAGRVRLLLGSVEELPVPDVPFDKVLSVNSFQFWEDPGRRLREIFERMAPGGRIAITLQPRHRGATQADAAARGAEIARLLSEAGFGEVRTETLALRPVDAVCAIGTRC